MECLNDVRPSLRSAGIPVECLHATPFVMNIIKVTPTRFDYVNGTLKERGFSPRQHIDF